MYDLLRKDSKFKFGSEELNSFETLKKKLIDSPVLAIYSPHYETELHCDASSLGYGAILMQKQLDGRFHPVAYFSKRVSETEKKYHSFELETLAIIYALRRFRIYLVGLKFKIITDCQSFALTLSKKLINPRISRWVLELQSYDYVIEHRNGSRMTHADALSRSINVLNTRDESFEYVLAAAQKIDPKITAIASELEVCESQWYEMVDGLIYRKVGDQIRFYVPENMENRVIQTHHEAMCHLGEQKCYDQLSRTYWFPKMKEKIRKYIKSCLKCIYFSPNSGKGENVLHNIPKGNLPFETLHIDHLGPISSSKKRHIFLVIDGFTKFIKLFPVNSTSSREAIKCLQLYFGNYSRPNRIISDRGSCFTSQEFEQFMVNSNIKHIMIATSSPQSNGQVERMNRVLIPMLAKECEAESSSNWYKHVAKIESALNNTVSRSTGFSPSMLLFGVNQKGQLYDKVAEYLQPLVEGDSDGQVRLVDKRRQAGENIKKNQEYNKVYYDKHHKPPYKYKVGEYVMIKNNVNLAGVNKKLFAKFRGPYEVVKVLDNDRYVIKDLEGMQITRVPYRGICSPANMRQFLFDPKETTTQYECLMSSERI